MGKTFACSDLHGMYNLYEQMNSFLAPDDRVYFLGDAGDRGSDGWKILKAIYENPQWIYLKGNHEDMLMKAMIEAVDDFYGEDTMLLYNNGGWETLDSWVMDGMRRFWIDRLRQLPTFVSYTNTQGQIIYLSHAGFTPGEDWSSNPPQTSFLPRDNNALIWDRKHTTRPWREGYDNFIICHGHTPIPHLAKRVRADGAWEPGALWYCNNHKVCIDNGSFATGFGCMLDLDSFDEHIFQVPSLIDS